MPKSLLALAPLDNRPCNIRFPAQLAAIDNTQLLTPPADILGDLHSPGNADLVRDWISNLPQVEALIVSIDMLAYGGLVFSRRPTTTQAEALERLQILREFKAQRPDVPIYAFNILMRLAITMDSDAAAANYYNVMRYARLVDEAERFQSEYLREQLAQVKAEIPPEILAEYLAARARNHQINGQMIEWLGEGIFDYLLITQEDAAEFGLHRREQDALLKAAGELNVGSKMSLHPGADEAAMTLLARHWNTQVKFRVRWSSLEDSRRIAPFEDRPFDDSLYQHVEALNGVLVEEGESDFEFFINAPVGGWHKDEDDPKRNLRAARLNGFVRDLEAALEDGKRVALCDVAFPNGADDVLMNALDKRGLFGKLSAYGGWNTAGNTLGTVLSQCAAIFKSDFDAEHSEFNRQFVFERLLDDWFYQSRVRARIEKTARDNGISPLDLNGGEELVEAQARRELRNYGSILASRHFKSTLQKCEVCLPWHRTFEVDLRAQLSPLNVPETDEVSLS